MFSQNCKVNFGDDLESQHLKIFVTLSLLGESRSKQQFQDTCTRLSTKSWLDLNKLFPELF